MNDLTVEKALDFVQSLLEQKGLSMNDNDRRLFPYIWNWNPDVNAAEQYQNIAAEINYSYSYTVNTIQRDHAAHLRRLLKDLLKARITNENLKEVVQREWNRRSQGVYVERPPLENDCYRKIENPLAEMIRIQAPQKMGKSMLVGNIFHKYASDPQKKYLTVQLDFQGERNEVFSNYEKFLQWFCRTISQNLKRQNVNVTDNLPSDAPDEHAQINYYFEDNILKRINNQILVLALRKLDRVFPLDFASNFLSLLRGWYNKGQNDYNWGKLRLILMYSKECQVKFPEGLSPFNVGYRAELREFNNGEISNFAQQHRINLNDDYIEKMMLQVGGHPYLISQIIRKLKTESTQKKESFEKLISSSLTEEFFNQHLDEDIWDKLQSIRYQNSETFYNLTMTTLKNLLENQQVVIEYDEDSEKIYFILDSLGLVKIDRDEKKQDVMKFRNNLYHEYLRNKLPRG